VGQIRPGETFAASAYSGGWLAYNGGFISRSVVRAAARDGCETVEQTAYTRKYGRETERYRACRKSGGGWELSKI
jgi:hypothetical protein